MLVENDMIQSSLLFVFYCAVLEDAALCCRLATQRIMNYFANRKTAVFRQKTSSRVALRMSSRRLQPSETGSLAWGRPGSYCFEPSIFSGQPSNAA